MDFQPRGFQILAKPVGPNCNLDCKYCFYLEKEALFPDRATQVMTDEVLRAYTYKYLNSQPTDLVQFVWQGGEPMLAGLDFYKRALVFQQSFRQSKKIKNSIQTNGTLIDDDWCRFLKANDFMVGISLDGPKEIHDHYRTDRRGEGSFDKAMRGLRLLQKYEIEYNVLVTIGKETASRPLDIYRFLKDEGVEFVQFAPVIERSAGSHEQSQGLKLAGMATANQRENEQVTEWSVEPGAYGDFLIAVFDEWIRNDVGQTFVMNFEWALNAWLGNTATMCQHAKKCGAALILEHNGDVFACDHCVYPEYRLGNIIDNDPMTMIQNSRESGFGEKDSTLPESCKHCEVLRACWGGCPKHRFCTTDHEDQSRYYLCKGNKKFYLHISKYLHGMAELIKNDLPVSMIMQAIDGPLIIDKSRI